MKKTALYETHLALGAKMVDFAGFEMPVQYTGIIQEHTAVREQVGLFDVSHMGEFFIEGTQALECVQYLCSNDISKIVDGQAQYNYLPNEKGGVVDDLIVYRYNADKFMLVVNASNIDKDWKWIQQVIANKGFDVSLQDQSEHFALLALQGPKATEVLAQLTDVVVEEIKFYHFALGEVADINDVIISATGYTGSGGFEIYVPQNEAITLWKKLLEAGEKFGIQPCGLGARDTLRVEAGYCLYGHEITDDISPLEAGLGWVTKLDTHFIGSDILAQEKEQGIKRRVTPLLVKQKGGIPRQGYAIVNADGEQIGEVSSGTSSPTLKQGIALAFLDKAYTTLDTEVYLQVRNKTIACQVVKLPFFKLKTS